jgi:hypothetical protein
MSDIGGPVLDFWAASSGLKARDSGPELKTPSITAPHLLQTVSVESKIIDPPQSGHRWASTATCKDLHNKSVNQLLAFVANNPLISKATHQLSLEL